MKIELELPEIEGFEYTGEYRAPQIGEWFLNTQLQAMEAKDSYDHICSSPILKPVEKWIVPTLEYIQKNYKWGETVEARFRDTSEQEWKYSELIFIKHVKLYSYVASPYGCFNFCEIKEVSKK